MMLLLHRHLTIGIYALLLTISATAFSPAFTSPQGLAFPTSSALASTKPQKKKGYEPKWKKKQTLADANGGGPASFQEAGLKGTIPVVFKQGNETRATVALPGQPLRDVATQANQFIKYGCGKGLCGACTVHLDGALVTPAFVDAHAHITDTGLAMRGVDLSTARSGRDVLAAVEGAARSGMPVLGHGWDIRSRPFQRRARRVRRARAPSQTAAALRYVRHDAQVAAADGWYGTPRGSQYIARAPETQEQQKA